MAKSYNDEEDVYLESEAREIFLQIITAIHIIHTNNITHRDIKPENFVFESEGSNHLKLIDFGLSAPLYTY